MEKRFASAIENEDYSRFTIQTNFRRCLIGALLIFFFEIGTLLFFFQHQEFPYLWCGVAMHMGLCFFLFVCAFFQRRSPFSKWINTRLFGELFWSISAFGMVPYVIQDAINNTPMPISALMYLILLITLPIYYDNDVYYMFGGYFLGCLLIFLLCRTNPSQIFLLFFVCVAGCLLSLQNRRQAHDLLHYQSVSRVDLLTEILNRRGAMEYLPRVFTAARAQHGLVASFMIDIDFFKQYNDNYGHSEGDRALFLLAQALERTCKSRSDIVSRYGGEEFWVLASVPDEQAADVLAKQMIAAVDALKLKLTAAIPFLTISIGYSVFSPDDMSEQKSGDVLVTTADNALYQAKRSGKHCAVRFHSH